MGGDRAGGGDKRREESVTARADAVAQPPGPSFDSGFKGQLKPQTSSAPPAIMPPRTAAQPHAPAVRPAPLAPVSDCDAAAAAVIAAPLEEAYELCAEHDRKVQCRLRKGVREGKEGTHE